MSRVVSVVMFTGLTLVLLSLDISIFKNTVDPDQLAC